MNGNLVGRAPGPMTYAWRQLMMALLDSPVERRYESRMKLMETVADQDYRRSHKYVGSFV